VFGTSQRDDDATSLIAWRLVDLARLLGDLPWRHVVSSEPVATLRRLEPVYKFV